LASAAETAGLAKLQGHTINFHIYSEDKIDHISAEYAQNDAWLCMVMANKWRESDNTAMSRAITTVKIGRLILHTNDIYGVPDIVKDNKLYCKAPRPE